jgi:hypothetical protein
MATDDSRTTPAPRLKYSEVMTWIAEATAPPKPALPRVPAPPSSAANTLVRLPAWPDAARAVPNGVLRSALFGVIGKGPRRYLKVERLAALEGIELFYTGEQLDQGDLDVWLGVLQLCRAQVMGEQCFFTAYELLKLLRKADTGGKGGNRKVLDARLNRLQVTGVRIRWEGRFSYQGPLIASVARDEATLRYVVTLDPKICALFGVEEFTLVDQAVRQALDGKPLAQWLHGFYASHAEPFAISVSKLCELCGSETKRVATHFKPKLHKALQAVADASEAHGQPFRFALEGDLVHVERTPSAAQRRHLAKRARKPSR